MASRRRQCAVDHSARLLGRYLARPVERRMAMLEPRAGEQGGDFLARRRAQIEQLAVRGAVDDGRRRALRRGAGKNEKPLQLATVFLYLETCILSLLSIRLR